MSRMEKRVRTKRMRTVKRWARAMRYTGYLGAMMTGVASAIFLMAVITA